MPKQCELPLHSEIDRGDPVDDVFVHAHLVFLVHALGSDGLFEQRGDLPEGSRVVVVAEQFPLARIAEHGEDGRAPGCAALAHGGQARIHDFALELLEQGLELRVQCKRRRRLAALVGLRDACITARSRSAMRSSAEPPMRLLASSTSPISPFAAP